MVDSLGSHVEHSADLTKSSFSPINSGHGKGTHSFTEGLSQGSVGQDSQISQGAFQPRAEGNLPLLQPSAQPPVSQSLNSQLLQPKPAPIQQGQPSTRTDSESSLYHNLRPIQPSVNPSVPSLSRSLGTQRSQGSLELLGLASRHLSKSDSFSLPSSATTSFSTEPTSDTGAEGDTEVYGSSPEAEGSTYTEGSRELVSPGSPTSEASLGQKIPVPIRKRRTTALSPVVVSDSADTVAVRRARNTEAARRSRARKMERMGHLERHVSALTDENNQLRGEIRQLQDEIQRLRTLSSKH